MLVVVLGCLELARRGGGAMTRRHLPAEACGPSCTCPHYGTLRVLTHPACPVHGHGGTWKLAPEALAAYRRTP